MGGATSIGLLFYKEGNKCVNYNMLIPVLIDAVKSLQAEVNALKENR